MSKFILLPRPVKIISFCDVCIEDTEQIVAFIKYENKTHSILYHHKCCKCRSKGKFTANVSYWVEHISKGNRLNEN